MHTVLSDMNANTSDLSRRDAAEAIVLKSTALAAVSGAVPVPAISLVIIAENAAMIVAVADAMGAPVTAFTVARSLGLAQTINCLGRAIFVEGARCLGWGPVVIPLGAITAGLQTWLVGQVAIAIAANDGRALEREEAEAVVARARASYPL